MATGKSESIVYGFAPQTDSTTTAVGAYTAMRKREATLTTTVAEIDSGETSGGRLADAPGRGRETHAASFTANFREADLDIFLRSAFAGDWVDNAGTDVLEIGSNPVYITLAEYIPWLAAGSQYTTYTGFQVGTLQMNFPQDGFVNAAFELQGGSKAASATAPWASLDTTSTKQSLRTCNSLQNPSGIQLATQQANPLANVASICPTVDFSVTNSLTELFDARSCQAVDSSQGTAVVTANIASYLDDDTRVWQVDGENGEEAKARFVWRGETMEYTFELPHATNGAVRDQANADAVGMNLALGAVNGPTTPSITRRVF